MIIGVGLAIVFRYIAASQACDTIMRRALAIRLFFIDMHVNRTSVGTFVHGNGFARMFFVGNGVNVAALVAHAVLIVADECASTFVELHLVSVPNPVAILVSTADFFGFCFAAFLASISFDASAASARRANGAIVPLMTSSGNRFGFFMTALRAGSGLLAVHFTGSFAGSSPIAVRMVKLCDGLRLRLSAGLARTGFLASGATSGSLCNRPITVRMRRLSDGLSFSCSTTRTRSGLGTIVLAICRGRLNPVAVIMPKSLGIVGGIRTSALLAYIFGITVCIAGCRYCMSMINMLAFLITFYGGRDRFGNWFCGRYGSGLVSAFNNRLRFAAFATSSDHLEVFRNISVGNGNRIGLFVLKKILLIFAFGGFGFGCFPLMSVIYFVDRVEIVKNNLFFGKHTLIGIIANSAYIFNFVANSFAVLVNKFGFIGFVLVFSCDVSDFCLTTRTRSFCTDTLIFGTELDDFGVDKLVDMSVGGSGAIIRRLGSSFEHRICVVGDLMAIVWGVM